MTANPLTPHTQRYILINVKATNTNERREHKQPMKATDYRAATYDSLVLCVEHFPLTKQDGTQITLESEGVYPIFASDEWDSFPVCDVCGREHDYVGLTSLSLAQAEYDETEGSTNE